MIGEERLAGRLPLEIEHHSGSESLTP